MSYAAWLQQAKSDLAAAKVLAKSGFHSQAIWMAAQAVEKGHKAILVALGLRYEDKDFKKLRHDTSDIAALLPPQLHEPVRKEIAESLASLESRAKTARYPSIQQDISGSIVKAPAEWMNSSEKEIRDAEELLAWCETRVERALRAAAAMRPATAAV
ncbi:MAG TPA: HEPN domain-containing protein [Myxococcales bacterium]|jgi:HEPN domain-containing protein